MRRAMKEYHRIASHLGDLTPVPFGYHTPYQQGGERVGKDPFLLNIP